MTSFILEEINNLIRYKNKTMAEYTKRELTKEIIQFKAGEKLYNNVCFEKAVCCGGAEKGNVHVLWGKEIVNKMWENIPPCM